MIEFSLKSVGLKICSCYTGIMYGSDGRVINPMNSTIAFRNIKVCQKVCNYIYCVTWTLNKALYILN